MPWPSPRGREAVTLEELEVLAELVGASASPCSGSWSGSWSGLPTPSW